MKKSRIILNLLIAVSLCAAVSGHAQPCPYYPADCPEADYANLDPAEDSAAKLGNPLVPQEVAMEHRLRRRMTDLIMQIAQKENWEAVELNEGGASGYRALPPNDTPLNYALRPPHWFGISFQVIVNKDSMAAWSAWVMDLSERRLAQVNKYADLMTGRQDKYKAYMDSADYYGDLKANYMTAHIQAYQQALVADNKAGIIVYEKALDAFDRKINVFVKKATDLQKDTESEQGEKDAEGERKWRGLAFRDASVLLVEFEFNVEIAFVEGGRAAGAGGGAGAGARGRTGGGDGGAVGEGGAGAGGGSAGTDGGSAGAGGGGGGTAAGGGESMRGFKLLRWYSNPEPDMLNAVHSYTHSRNVVLALSGGWNLRPDAAGFYLPTFRADKKNTDHTTIKTIKCDQVQETALYLSGNKAAIRKFLAKLPEGLAALSEGPAQLPADDLKNVSQ